MAEGLYNKLKKEKKETLSEKLLLLLFVFYSMSYVSLLSNTNIGSDLKLMEAIGKKETIL